MPADISTSLASWSTTAGSNAPADSTLIGGNLDDNLRQIQATVRAVWAQDTIASATTTDIGSKDAGSLTVTGTTTITGLGTVSAGIRKWLTFNNTLTLTHNGSSLILPGAANITTAAGDVALVESQGSGNWRCLTYQRASGGLLGSFDIADGTVSVPGLKFASDTDTGFYRVGANSLGVSAGGVNICTLSHAGFSLNPTVSTGNATATLNVNSDDVSTGTTTLNISATRTAGTGSSAVNIVGGVDKVTSPSLQLVGSYAPGGNATLSGGSMPPFTAGTGGTVAIAAGSCPSPLSGPTQVGGDVTIDSGLGYLSGTVWISSAATLNNNTYAEYGRITINAQRCGMDFRQVAGVIKNTGIAPTITSGAGSGASIRGTLNGFEITAGTGAGTAIVVALQGAGGVAPIPIAIAQCSANKACWVAATDQQVTINLASAPSSGEFVRCILMYV